ncbi:MAG: hypothetical protein LOX97_11630 [Sphingomonas sp.]|nr:hypothetical protein [Sphingomonas sp.]
MTDERRKDEKSGEQPPPPTLARDPERSIELEVKKRPDDENAKADLGSDESMDASDPSAAAQPGRSKEPAPSSGFPDKSAKK